MSFELPRPFREEKIIAPPANAAVLRFRELLKDPTKRIDIEFGCGVGWHPIRYAEAHPDRTLVAIEQTTEKFNKFQARLLSHIQNARPLENLISVQADAVAWITSFVPNASIDRVFIYYPNPNPKNAAARWIRMPFFGHLIKKLRADGEISFRTNRTDYVNEVRTYGTHAWQLVPVVDRTFSQREVMLSDALTHFERKYLAAGDDCSEVKFRLGIN